METNTILFIYHSDYFSLPTNVKVKVPTIKEYDVKSILENDGSGDLWEVSKVDWRLNEICINLDTPDYQSVHTIIINTRLRESESIDLVLQLATHLKLHKFANNELYQRRILLCGYEIPNLKNISETAKSFISILQVNGIQLVKYESIFNIKSGKIGIETYLAQFVLRQRKQEILNTLIVLPNENMGRHSIANQWGALRLFMAAGGEINNISYQFPQTAYFKYVLRKLECEENNASFPSQLTPIFAPLILNKILLIDDEAQKGWKEVICKVLSIDEANVIVKEKYEDIADGNGDLLVNANDYDIILLDLRIPKNGNNFNIENGIDLLMKIKKEYPASAVVIFTATNKAWNIQYIFEQGADGYFIKEAPETTSNEFSLRNYEHFKKTIQHCYKKSSLLKPYSENIVKIKDTIIIQNKGAMKIQERIKERLDMFFGLLKKGFERSEFDKSLFHYSDYELAFLTLWSVFNEVQEGIYDKTNSDEWKLIGTSEFYFNKIGTETKPRSYLLYAQDSLATDRYLLSTSTRQNVGKHKINIDYQIAYLLYKGNEFVTHSAILPSFLRELYYIKEIRNKLYLTHGADSNADFFEKTEKEKREVSLSSIHPESGGDIHKLFNLVAFVLTGDDTIKLP